MIKRLRVTVDGNTYDVTVELPEESASSASAVPPVISAPQASAPAASASPTPTSTPPAPTPAPAQSAAPQPAASRSAGDVPCPLAGRVTAVVISVGQEVKEGDHLVTLEAMKMNTFVFAPRDGKVTAVKTEIGAVVEEGQVLATIG